MEWVEKKIVHEQASCNGKIKKSNGLELGSKKKKEEMKEKRKMKMKKWKEREREREMER